MIRYSNSGITFTEKNIISDRPKVQLSFGSQLEASNIKEGNDVYFECKVRAHPRHYKITWKRNVSITTTTVLLFYLANTLHSTLFLSHKLDILLLKRSV